MTRGRPREAEAEGVPPLQLRDEDRDALAALIAELLIAALQREGTPQTRDEHTNARAVDPGARPCREPQTLR